MTELQPYLPYIAFAVGLAVVWFGAPRLFRPAPAPVPTPVPAPLPAQATPVLTESEIVAAGVAFHKLTLEAANQQLAAEMTRQKIAQNVAVFTQPFHAAATDSAPKAP